MKTVSRYIVVLVVISLFFTLLTAGAVAWGLWRVNQTDREAIASVIAVVKEKYPQITDKEIIEILNGKAENRQIADITESYGIKAGDVYVLSNRQNYWNTILLDGAAALLFAAAVLVFFLIYVHRKNRQELKLTQYLSDINNGNYSLPTQVLSEDKHSLLYSEVYKTTVMLREKSEQSARDKADLKDSLSDISHQLKTPLTSMLIMIDNILEEDMPEELRREFLCDIRSSVNHVSFLTKSLLTLSMLDADTITFHQESVSIKLLFAHCTGNVNAIAQEKGVILTQTCQEDIQLVCDERWISEALTNIIKNCIEHTPKGGSVTLTAEDNSLYTKITIADTGCGIDKDDLPHIFERFYRGKNADENSVGIGLAMSKSIIEKCGGYIRVISEQGKGTTFIIKFFKVR